MVTEPNSQSECMFRGKSAAALLPLKPTLNQRWCVYERCDGERPFHLDPEGSSDQLICMLIIATPKSASSSLARTLAEATGSSVANKAAREVLKDNPRAEGYPHLAVMHRGDNFELTPGTLASFLAVPGVKKHHIRPTAGNLDLLRQTPKIVLLRPAEEVIDAYWRGFDSGVWPHAFTVKGQGRTIEAWREAAQEMGLVDELTRFNEGWARDPGKALMLDYEVVVSESGKAVRLALDYFGHRSATVLPLAREKFTRTETSGPFAFAERAVRRAMARTRLALKRPGALQ